MQYLNNSNENENHIKLHPSQNMMLHSSEPSLVQHDTIKEMNVSTTISNNNSGTRDASTSTVPITKHMMQMASAPSMPQEGEKLSGGRVFQPHTVSSKEEPRLQTAR